MTGEQFVEFLNKSQRDPRLNEILYPYANVARAKDLIGQHEPSKSNAQRGRIAWKNLCMLFYVHCMRLGVNGLHLQQVPPSARLILKWLLLL